MREQINFIHIFNIMPKRHNILPTRTSSFTSSARKIKVCRNSKSNFSSRCFIADDSHVKTLLLHVVVFTEQDILNF